MVASKEREYFSRLAEQLRRTVRRPVKIMEVCGTHTMAIAAAGIRQILPPEVELVSGPGCPVCVTADVDIDAFLRLAVREDVTVATYGDMLRVPGTEGSLADMRARGGQVQVVYSATEALQLARENPGREVVFLAVGFETTAPATAHALTVAQAEKISNFSIFNLHKTVPPALRALLADEETAVDGFILPGHVSAIIGEEPYRFVAEEFGRPGVIAGFEPVEIMAALVQLVTLLNRGEARIINLYRHVVRPEGNRTALALLERVFQPDSAIWRGLGEIPDSGLKLRDELSLYDAELKFGVTRKPVAKRTACRCGDILKGLIKPSACPLFARGCTPERPQGPCMVSAEGTCAAYYHYLRRDSDG